MKYFVTGATGFIGGKLVDALLARGHQVVALVRNPQKAQHLAQKGVELHTGDIIDKASMKTPMTGVDGVFHCAAWYKVGEKSDQAYEINVNGTRNVLELMRELKIAKGVYTSSLAVFGDTQGTQADESYYFDPKQREFISAYDKTKWQAHYEVALPMMKQGLRLVIVQPGLVYGPDDTSTVREMFIQYLTGKLPVVPEQTAYSWGYVDDVVEGHILAMEKGTVGESYIICGESKTILEAMALAKEISGKPIPMIIQPSILKVLANITTLVNYVIPLKGQYHPELLRSTAGTTYTGDNSKARKALGYQPRPLSEGLRETLHHEMKLLGMR